MSPPIPEHLFTVEVRDSADEPWRPMCESGPDGTEEATIYGWRTKEMADEMPRNSQGILAFREARVVRWQRVTSDG